MLFTLRARWVLPIDQPPIEGGYVGVAGERIVAVGRTDPAISAVTDLGHVVLMPGLINAHTHLEFSALPKPLGTPGASLPDWIRLVIADRNRGDRKPQAAIAAGLRESLAHGVTTIGEIAAAPPTFYASAESRPKLLQFQEVIGFSAGRVDSAFDDAQRRLESTSSSAGLSPHAPYTVHPLLLERLVRLASTRNVPVAMHLAESREELRLLKTGDGPFRELLEERSMWDREAISTSSRPLDYLKMLAEAPRSLVIHGNYLADEEIEFIAGRRDRMSVVFCPRTHGWFGHEPYPLEVMLQAGVHVAVGTDSRASNPDLRLLAELRSIAIAFPSIAPAQIVQLGTLNGAMAMGLAEHVGSLTPGKLADFAAMPMNEAGLNPYEQLLRGPMAPSAIWLAGQRQDPLKATLGSS
jgi:cytosine/adenosine deaminase-related metal-dependent hydrolase